MIMASATQRPVRFVMHYSFLHIPLTGRIFRDAKVIPIAGSRENASILDAAFDRISEELRAGETDILPAKVVGQDDHRVIYEGPCNSRTLALALAQ